MKIERAVIEVNGGCNYTCQMCPQTNPGRHKGFLKKMPLELFEDIVAQCAEKGLKVVNLEGSGEPTLIKNLPKYIEVVRKYGANADIFSNGFRFEKALAQDCIDAGLSRFRVSVIGYNPEQYIKWMDRDAFDKVKQNMKEAVDYINLTKSDCLICSYHLITDNNQVEYEIEQYRKNFVDELGIKTEIWKMHNWSGVYENPNKRSGGIKTCGRPFAPEITVRAGGLDDKLASVAPCCQTLGRDEESILGYLSENTIEEVWFGDEYEKLREGHRTGNYPSYCQNCDFLIDDPEVLVYTNYDREVHKLAGTTFSLDDYRK
jgi:organic radical activating enzyme